MGFDILHSRQFLRVPQISFNILQKVLVWPAGYAFLGDARKDNRAVFVWTVNDLGMMRWSIRNQVDGVITDDPVTLARVREMYNGGYCDRERWTLGDYVSIVVIRLFGTFVGIAFRWWYGFKIGPTW